MAFYVSYNTSLSPAPVACWYNTTSNPILDYTKDGFLEVNSDQYTNRNNGYWAVENGSLVPFVPPISTIPLSAQATLAFTSARTYIYNNYGILNEDTPDVWVSYLKAIMAIRDGTDTKSSVLPVPPPVG